MEIELNEKELSLLCGELVARLNADLYGEGYYEYAIPIRDDTVNIVIQAEYGETERETHTIDGVDYDTFSSYLESVRVVSAHTYHDGAELDGITIQRIDEMLNELLIG